MNAFALIARLRAAGITLGSDGSKLKASPRSAVTPDLANLIAANKPDLISALADEAAVNRWLASIRETDPAIVKELFERIGRDSDCRRFYVSLGRRAPEPA